MSKDERQNDAIKKENKKVLKVFIPVIIVAGLIGGVFGFFSQTELLQNFSGDIGTVIGDMLFRIIPYLVILTEVVTFAGGLVYYKKAQKDFAAYEAVTEGMASAETEDEELLDQAFEKADWSISMSLVVTNIGTIGGFLFFGIFMCNLTRMLDADIFILPILAILAFIAGMFITLKLQQLATDLVKRMNPKMRGSVYDVNFNKKWEASCDEAEMMAIYKASYKAFRTANLTCVVLWVMVCLGDMFFHYGSMPVVAVSVIWLIMLSSYYMESFRQEHRSSRP